MAFNLFESIDQCIVEIRGLKFHLIREFGPRNYALNLMLLVNCLLQIGLLLSLNQNDCAWLLSSFI